MRLETETKTVVVGHQCHDAIALSLSTESSNHHSLLRHSKVLLQTLELEIIFALVAFLCLFLYHSSSFAPFSVYYTKHHNSSENTMDLKSILKKAATSNNTVSITTLNDAWAEPNSVFDLFLESFQTGNQTQRLLNHLVVVAWDQKAYACCLKLHPHCYNLSTDGVDFSEEACYMAPDYLNMMWRRTNFLRNVVDLGCNFIFTLDADHIMWFRDPFPHFHEDGDFQIACDYFNGNPVDLNNLPNRGFIYVKSNNKTTQFYKYWWDSKLTYPGLNEQDVFNKIKYGPFFRENGLQMRFLYTVFFGGFCEPSRDFNKVCTMHANCCVGLESKVQDLGILLKDWLKYMNSFVNRTSLLGSWNVPRSCRDHSKGLVLPGRIMITMAILIVPLQLYHQSVSLRLSSIIGIIKCREFVTR